MYPNLKNDSLTKEQVLNPTICLSFRVMGYSEICMRTILLKFQEEVSIISDSKTNNFGLIVCSTSIFASLLMELDTNKQSS